MFFSYKAIVSGIRRFKRDLEDDAQLYELYWREKLRMSRAGEFNAETVSIMNSRYFRPDLQKQGYRLTLFLPGASWALKLNDVGPNENLWGPGFGGKLNSFQHHCQAFAALCIIEVKRPSKSVFL